MNAGGIEQLGAPPAVYERPATPFVARFLGFENLLSGRADGAGEVTTGVGRFRPAGPPSAPGEVTLLIKPALDQVDVAGDMAAGSNVIEGVVDAVAFRGRFCQVWLVAVSYTHLDVYKRQGNRLAIGLIRLSTTSSTMV